MNLGATTVEATSAPTRARMLIAGELVQAADGDLGTVRASTTDDEAFPRLIEDARAAGLDLD